MTFSIIFRISECKKSAALISTRLKRILSVSNNSWRSRLNSRLSNVQYTESVFIHDVSEAREPRSEAALNTLNLHDFRNAVKRLNTRRGFQQWPNVNVKCSHKCKCVFRGKTFRDKTGSSKRFCNCVSLLSISTPRSLTTPVAGIQCLAHGQQHKLALVRDICRIF